MSIFNLRILQIYIYIYIVNRYQIKEKHQCHPGL